MRISRGDIEGSGSGQGGDEVLSSVVDIESIGREMS